MVNFCEPLETVINITATNNLHNNFFNVFYIKSLNIGSLDINTYIKNTANNKPKIILISMRCLIPTTSYTQSVMNLGVKFLFYFFPDEVK